VLQLQTLAGNRAVSRLLSSGTYVAGVDHPFEQHAGPPDGSRVPGSAPSVRRSPLATDSGTPVYGKTARRLGLSPESVVGVRVHRGADADEMTEALGAEGFSHGSDVFLSREFSRPGSAAATDVMGHELAHATGPAAATGGLFLKRRKKHLDFLRFKKKETHITRMLASMALDKLGAHGLAERVDTDSQGDSYDHYGHWWIEAGSLAPDNSSWNPVESFGWWPAHSVGFAETLKITRVEGQLNQGGRVDPHHGESADTEYHPVLEVDDKDDYETVRDTVMDKVRTFAKGFSGSWNWRLGWGKNCHTFMERMKKAIGLHHQKASAWLRGGGVEREKVSYAAIRAELDKFGLIGGGFGFLSQAGNWFTGKFSAEDIAALTDAERRQLMDDINQGVEGFNRARASEINDFFSTATGTTINLFTDDGSGNGAVTGPPIEDQLLPYVGKAATLDKPLKVGSTTLAKDEQVYVHEITDDDKVRIERTIAAGGGRFVVDGAAFLAAVKKPEDGSSSPQSSTTGVVSGGTDSSSDSD